VPITYNNLPFSEFTFRRTDYSGKVRDLKVATSSATWVTTELMNPNSAAIFEVVKLQ